MIHIYLKKIHCTDTHLDTHLPTEDSLLIRALIHIYLQKIHSTDTRFDNTYLQKIHCTDKSFDTHLPKEDTLYWHALIHIYLQKIHCWYTLWYTFTYRRYTVLIHPLITLTYRRYTVLVLTKILFLDVIAIKTHS